MIGREIDRVRVVVRAEPVAIYEIVAARTETIAPETTELLDDFEHALGLCRARRFDEAKEAFLAIAEQHPEDGPTEFYVERCGEYCAEPPPLDWDGVYQITSK